MSKFVGYSHSVEHLKNIGFLSQNTNNEFQNLFDFLVRMQNCMD